VSERPIPAGNLQVLSPWATELAQTFVLLSSDIALVLDDRGVIQDVAQGGAVPMAPAAHEWIGHPWADTVTGETRDKIALLLQEVNSTGQSRKREINHLSRSGDASIAVSYSAIRQRFLDVQQELERGYWRARQAESRYRLLFQVATDAVLVVDAVDLNILEANQGASDLFELSADQMVGRPASFGFESLTRGPVDELLQTARRTGQPAEIRARLAGRVGATTVLATPFRVDDAMRLLVRVRNLDVPGSAADLNATLARLVDSTSDGVVVTDPRGRILVANPAFLQLVHLATEAQVKGRPLMDWIGVSDSQLEELIVQVRRKGVTRRIAAQLLTADARLSDVSISAALLTEGDQESIGFTIHYVAPRPLPVQDTEHLTQALDVLVARVGSASLPDLLEETVRMARQHFVRAALERCGQDRAAAAALLGITADQLVQVQMPDGAPNAVKRPGASG
jgi:transcriptional regulator PpsR